MPDNPAKQLQTPLGGGRSTIPLRYALVSEAEISPDNAETRRIRTLIGKPLTRVEFFQNGNVVFEFDPFGEISVRPLFDQEIQTSVFPNKTETGLAKSSAKPKTGSQTIE